MIRWEHLEPAVQASLEEAWAAYRVDTNPVGSVITDATGAVLVRARNRIHDPSEAPAGQIKGSRIAHAEVNALLALAALGVDPRECSLVTTCEPCAMCTGAIAMHRLREVRYLSRDTWAGSLLLLEASGFMRGRGVALRGPDRTDLEHCLVALHVEFTLAKGFALGPVVIEKWAQTHPIAAEAGRALRASGELRVLAERGATVQEALRLLASRTLMRTGA